MYKNKKVLITGGLGFIGVHSVEKWLSNDWDIVAIDNFSTNAINPEDIDFYKNVEVINSNLLGIHKNKLKEIELIVHLASPVGPVGVLKHSGRMGSMSIDDLNWCMDVSRENQGPLIFISTSEMYGFRGGKAYLKKMMKKFYMESLQLEMNTLWENFLRNNVVK